MSLVVSVLSLFLRWIGTARSWQKGKEEEG
jgi:hypothetical protein